MDSSDPCACDTLGRNSIAEATAESAVLPTPRAESVAATGSPLVAADQAAAMEERAAPPGGSPAEASREAATEERAAPPAVSRAEASRENESSHKFGALAHKLFSGMSGDRTVEAARPEGEPELSSAAAATGEEASLGEGTVVGGLRFRMASVTGRPDYQFGDLSRTAFSRLWDGAKEAEGGTASVVGVALGNSAPSERETPASGSMAEAAAEAGSPAEASRENESSHKFGVFAQKLFGMSGDRTVEVARPEGGEPELSSAAAATGEEASLGEGKVIGGLRSRMALTGNPDYQFGDLTRTALSRLWDGAKEASEQGGTASVVGVALGNSAPSELGASSSETPANGSMAEAAAEAAALPAPRAESVDAAGSPLPTAATEEHAAPPGGSSAEASQDHENSHKLGAFAHKLFSGMSGDRTVEAARPQGGEPELSSAAAATGEEASLGGVMMVGGLRSRMASVTGRPDYQFGDLTRTAFPNTHESAKQAGARMQEGMAQAHESVKQTGMKVADGAQSVGQAVNSGLQSAIPAVQEASRTIADSTLKAHQDIKQAHQEGGSGVAIEKGAIHLAQAGLSAYAGYIGVSCAAKEKAFEAGAVAAQYVHESVGEERQAQLSEGASKVLQGTKYVAQKVAEHGEVVIKQAYDTYIQAGNAMQTATEEAYAGLPEEKRRAIEEKRRRVEESKEHFKELGMTVVRPMWKSVSGSAGRALRDACVSDPDMWTCVRQSVGPLIEALWTDIEEEVEKGLELSIYKDPPVLREGRPPSGLLRLRAAVLHHFLPCDKSIFGMLKDPVYLGFLAITLFPFYSARVIFYAFILLLLWAAPDQVDEYQLVCFILSAKGMQFLTSGVINNAYGSAEYYYAMSFCDGDAQCLQNHTPGQNSHVIFPVIDFFGSVGLVWAAFWLLPHSRKHGLRAQRAALRQETMPEMLRQSVSDREAVLSDAKARGGRLRIVLRWDLASFLLCVLLLVVLQSVGSRSCFLANLFWCRVVYSLLSFPFFLFYLPGLRQLLTHAESTGFAADGRCVPYKLRELPAPKQPLLRPPAASPGEPPALSSVAAASSEQA